MKVTTTNDKLKTKRGHNCAINKGKSKSKAVLLQAWSGPEGSRRLRFPDFKTVGT